MAVLYLGESMYFHKGEYKNDKAALKSRNSFAVWKILSFKKKKKNLDSTFKEGSIISCNKQLWVCFLCFIPGFPHLFEF